MEIFSQVGPVSLVRVCRDNVSRRSLGYAYVNYTTPEHAKDALERFNAEPLENRPMRVAYVNRDPSSRRSGSGNTFISNLAKTIDERSLLETMAQFGKVISVKISSDERGVSRGYGFVQFGSEQEASEAINKLNGMTLEGQTIKVAPYKSKIQRVQDKEQNFKNIFIKGLPPTFTDDDLKNLFEPFGKISRLTVRKTEAGVAKGFGFVEYEQHESAAEAVAKLQAQQIDDAHSLHVERALSKAELNEKKRLRNPRNEGQPNNLYVKHLDDTTTEEGLRNLFSPFGNIKSIRIMRDDKGNVKGFGFVSFDTSDAATKAATELNCCFFGSKPLYVAKFQTKEQRQRHLQSLFRQPQPARYAPYPAYPFGAPPMAMPVGYPTNPPFAQAFSQRRGPQGPQGNRLPRAGPYPGPPVGPGGVPGGPGAPGYNRNPRASAQAGGVPRQGGARYQAQPPPQQQRAAEFSAQSLASLPPDQQKQMIGERLYNKIFPRNGPKTGKITGMLLEMDTAELLHLLEDDAALQVKEQEALKVLNEHKA